MQGEQVQQHQPEDVRRKLFDIIYYSTFTDCGQHKLIQAQNVKHAHTRIVYISLSLSLSL